MDSIPGISPIYVEPSNENSQYAPARDRRKPKGQKPDVSTEDDAATSGEDSPADADAKHLLDLDA
jgi:hypothetical protein